MRQDQREKAEIELEQTEEALVWVGLGNGCVQLFALCADLLLNRRS
jgi:hypothetical protein